MGDLGVHMVQRNLANSPKHYLAPARDMEQGILGSMPDVVLYLIFFWVDSSFPFQLGI